jgi:hypothetical protein
MISAYQYILNNVNVKLAPSKIHGVGVFAIRDIPSGEKLFTKWTGKSGLYYLTEYELNTFDSNLKSHLYDMFEFIKVNNEWVFAIYLNKNCHWIFKTPAHWVNSCAWDELSNVDKETEIALKNIKMGDEIVFKYGKYNKYTKTHTI